MFGRRYRIIDIPHINEIMNIKCIIYGAGTYGNVLYSLLKIKGLSSKVRFFAVSNKEGNQEEIDGIPVKAVEELIEEMEKCNVLVAMANDRAEEVLQLLQRYKVKEVYCVTKQTIQIISHEIANEMKQIPIEQNKVFISCYEGMGYRCNCKYIAEKLIQEGYPVKIVWVIKNESGGDIPVAIKKVIAYTYEYYRELYTAKIFISNCGILPFAEKREGQYYINTWHGYGPFKKTEGAVAFNRERRNEIRELYSKFDLFLSGSTFYSQVYRDSFFYEGEIDEYGAPRNDIFFENNMNKESIYKKLDIAPDEKIVLYAPTFRTDIKNSFRKYDLDMSAVLEALDIRFNSKFVLIYRFHHYLYAMGECQDYYEEGIDVTYYPDIQELLMVADVVITDYSSLIWDFSLQRKPIFLYQNDEEEYLADRGFYCPVSQWPYPKAHSNEEMLDIIRNFDNKRYIRRLNTFLKKYGSCDNGNATRKVVEKIMKVIQSPFC